MPDWIVTLLEQWAVVTAAPIPFAIAIVGAAAVIWLATVWSTGLQQPFTVHGQRQ